MGHDKQIKKLGRDKQSCWDECALRLSVRSWRAVGKEGGNRKREAGEKEK